MIILKNRCEGCGAKIQTTNKELKGYIKSDIYLKNPDHFLCERCFNLVHYNRNKEVHFNDEDFMKNIDVIRETKGLVVNIVDVFDLEGTLIEKLNEYFPENDIILVANKFDLFLSSVRVGKIKNYLMNLLSSKNMSAKEVMIVSSYREEDMRRLINAIVKYQNRQDVYFFGMTNVGKSSLINAITKLVSEKPTSITVSNMVSTTLDFIKIPLGNKTYILDTPGIINSSQATYYLSKETLDIITPKKYIKPKTYQLNPKQALFVAAFCYLEFLEGKPSSFTTNFSNTLVIHRTKLENAKDFFDKHKEDILKFPTEDELKRLGEWTETTFVITEEKKDISISGLGFIAINGTCKVCVKHPIKVKISIRDSIV